MAESLNVRRPAPGRAGNQPGLISGLFDWTKSVAGWEIPEVVTTFPEAGPKPAEKQLEPTTRVGSPKLERNHFVQVSAGASAPAQISSGPKPGPLTISRADQQKPGGTGATSASITPIASSTSLQKLQLVIPTGSSDCLSSKSCPIDGFLQPPFSPTKPDELHSASVESVLAEQSSQTKLVSSSSNSNSSSTHSMTVPRKPKDCPLPTVPRGLSVDDLKVSSIKDAQEHTLNPSQSSDSLPSPSNFPSGLVLSSLIERAEAAQRAEEEKLKLQARQGERSSIRMQAGKATEWQRFSRIYGWEEFSVNDAAQGVDSPPLPSIPTRKMSLHAVELQKERPSKIPAGASKLSQVENADEDEDDEKQAEKRKLAAEEAMKREARLTLQAFDEGDSPNNLVFGEKKSEFSLSDHPIIAATRVKLVDRITRVIDTQLMKMFFIVYRLFMPSSELLHLFVLRFGWSFTDESINKRTVRLRTFVALRFWLENYYSIDFKPNRELVDKLLKLLEQVETRLRRVSSTDHGQDLKIVETLRQVITSEGAAVSFSATVAAVASTTSTSTKRKTLAEQTSSSNLPRAVTMPPGSSSTLRSSKQKGKRRSKEDSEAPSIDEIKKQAAIVAMAAAAAGAAMTNGNGEVSQTNTLTRERASTLKPSFHASRKSRSSIFSEYRSEVFAEVLAVIEQETVHSIHWQELLSLQWTKASSASREQARNIIAAIDRFNKLCLLVPSEIVRTVEVDERVKIFTRFIRIAKKCLDLNNYNSAMAITLGLQNPRVERLKLTLSKVSSGDADLLNLLKRFASPLKNFSGVRTAMNEMESKAQPSAPFIGLYLSDLVFTAEMPDTLTPQGAAQEAGAKTQANSTNAAVANVTQQLVHFHKFAIMAVTVQKFQRFQDPNLKYPFFDEVQSIEPHASVYKYLTSTEPLTDEEIGKLSEAREPRAKS